MEVLVIQGCEIPKHSLLEHRRATKIRIHHTSLKILLKRLIVLGSASLGVIVYQNLILLYMVKNVSTK